MLEEVDIKERMEEFGIIYRNHRKRLAQIISQEDSIEKLLRIIPEAFHASAKFLDSYVLCDLVLKNEAKKILEVGSFMGFSTSLLLRASLPHQGEVLSIDPGLATLGENISIPAIFEQMTKEFQNRLRIKRAYFAVTPEKRSPIDTITAPFDEEFDFIFIDGNHTVINVIEDFHLASKMLRPNGLIAFHDVCMLEVKSAIKWLAYKYSKRFDFKIHKAPLDYLYSPKLIAEFTPLDHASSSIGVFYDRKKK